MYLLDSDITTALANLLKQATTDLPDYAALTVTDCHAAAYNEILGRLAARGFTSTQIAAWDRGKEFEKDLSLWWCLVKMASLRAQVDNLVFQSLGRQAELKDVPVTNAGAAIRASGGIGSVGSGQQSDDNAQFFYEVTLGGPNQEPPDVNKTSW